MEREKGLGEVKGGGWRERGRERERSKKEVPLATCTDLTSITTHHSVVGQSVYIIVTMTSPSRASQLAYSTCPTHVYIHTYHDREGVFGFFKPRGPPGGRETIPRPPPQLGDHVHVTALSVGGGGGLVRFGQNFV